MIEIPSLRPETRYGIPMADQLLFNRDYIVGYSFLYRQPRFALEVIDPEKTGLEDQEEIELLKRLDNFRSDLRIPEKFRADLADYRGSGFDRGHLVASANRRERLNQNSETFLLSNMSPQVPGFNRGIWKKLEGEVRELATHEDVLEVYVVCGPLFEVGKKIEVIQKDEEDEVKVPIPHAFFKSVLAENIRGKLEMWSFVFLNEKSAKEPADFLTTTRQVEIRAGLSLWDRLRGQDSGLKRKGKGDVVWPRPEPD